MNCSATNPQLGRVRAIGTAVLATALSLVGFGCVMEAGVGVASHTTTRSDGTQQTSNNFDSSPDGNPTTRDRTR